MSASLVSPEVPVLDPKMVDDLRALAVANPRPGEDILGDLVGLFGRDTPPRLAGIREGWERREATVVAHAAHALRGSAMSLGARRVTALAETIDVLAIAAVKAGAPMPPMTEHDVAMVDQLAAECDVAIARMHSDFLGRPAPR